MIFRDSTMTTFTVLSGAGRRRYRQGRGGYRRRYRQGRGPKFQAFKRFASKGFALGKRHLLPHVKEFAKGVLMDAVSGRDIKSSLKDNAKRQAYSAVRRAQGGTPRRKHKRKRLQH